MVGGGMGGNDCRGKLGGSPPGYEGEGSEQNGQNLEKEAVLS